MNDIKNYWQEGVPQYHTWNPPSTTEFWSGFDTEENFKKNPNPSYAKTRITYTYNKFGFRTKEFDFTNTENNILCFGCSHTEGIGVQTPWPVLMQEQLLDYNVYNLGHGSGSFDTIARLITSYVPLFKPKKIFILWPPLPRYELYEDEGVKFVGAWVNDKTLIQLITDENMLNWSEKNKLYIKMFSKVYNFHIFEDESDIYCQFPQCLDRARDNAHFGSKTHISVANNFLKNIC